MGMVIPNIYWDIKEVLSLYNKRIKTLPDEVLTYEQAEYIRKKDEDRKNKLNKLQDKRLS